MSVERPLNGNMPRPGTWKPGESGNPAGRPVGARNKFSELFVRDGTGAKYTALANKIEASGDVERAASMTTTMGGWFLRRGIDAGYLDGEELVLRRGNTQWLRRHAKTKAGISESANVRADVGGRAEHIRRVASANKRLYEMIKRVPKAELSQLGIDPEDFNRARLQLPLRTNFPQKHKEPKRTGSKPPNATTWRKGGPNPRRRSRPDS